MVLLQALGHMATAASIGEIAQDAVYQHEQMRWSRRNYALDVQALKIDLLGAARDDVRGTYDTYIERHTTMLLLNGLVLPFALNCLQFSSSFLPHTRQMCEDKDEGYGDDRCIEVQHPWMVTIWSYFVGMELIMPFWSILMLLRCKVWLDTWLQASLDHLQEMRRNIISRSNENGPSVPTTETIKQQEGLIARVGEFIVDYQDKFASLWNVRCAPLVWFSTMLLWASAYGAIVLCGYMFWIFLVNRRGRQHTAHVHFAVLISIGLLMPIIFGVEQRRRGGGISSSACGYTARNPFRSRSVPSFAGRTGSQRSDGPGLVGPSFRAIRRRASNGSESPALQLSLAEVQRLEGCETSRNTDSALPLMDRPQLLVPAMD